MGIAVIRGTRSSARTAQVRAGLSARILVLIVLYALALQGVFGGLAMSVAAADHVLCIADPEGPDPLGSHPPVHAPMACCVACHPGAPIALPPLPAAMMVPTGYPTPPAGRCRPRVALPRAPPRRGLGARAPPVA